MPHVLLVHQPIDGGVGRHVSDVATGLSSRGFQVTLCGPALPEPVPSASANVSHITVPMSRAVSPRTDAIAVRDLVEAVRKVKPDLVHAHSSKAGAISRLQRLRNRRTPVLYTPHGYSFASHFAVGAQRLAYREMEHVLAPLTSRIVCVCESEARLARTVAAAKRVCVVYNGIAAAEAGPVDPRISELAGRGPVICAIALLRSGKGLETLIDATPSVLACHPHAQVAILGDGPGLEALRSRAIARKAAHAIHFLGFHPEPLRALRGAEVFVHPSLAEAFPYAILEAMAAGIPIVASNVGGIGEAVIDGQSATLVPPGQSGALGQALVAALDDPARQAEIAQAARTRFERYFTFETMLDRLISVYAQLSPAFEPFASTAPSARPPAASQRSMAR
jgi:glycosyltransferase involved in cell wall biosynthesis